MASATAFTRAPKGYSFAEAATLTTAGVTAWRALIVNGALKARKLFELRRKARLGQKDQLQQRIKQLQEQITGLTAQQAAKTKEMEIIGQELQGVRDLWAKNLVQINRLTSLQREEARLQGEHGQLIATAAEAKGKIVHS